MIGVQITQLYTFVKTPWMYTWDLYISVYVNFISVTWERERDKVHQTVIIKSSLYPTPMCTHIPSLPPSHSVEFRDCFLKATPEAASYSLFPLPRVLPLPSAQGQLRELIPKQWSLNQGGRCLWLLQAPFSPFLILGNIPALDQK